MVTERGTNSLQVFPVGEDGLLGEPVKIASSGPTPYGFAFGGNGALVVTEAFGAEKGKAAASAVNGSMGLGISAGSKHADEAWKFITFMTSQATQNKYAKLSLPIWKSSYEDAAVTKGQEKLIDAAKVSLDVMFARPTTPSYPELSSILQKNIQQVLLGQAPTDDALKAATKAAGRLR